MSRIIAGTVCVLIVKSNVPLGMSRYTGIFKVFVSSAQSLNGSNSEVYKDQTKL